MKKRTVLVSLVVSSMVFIGCSNAINPTEDQSAYYGSWKNNNDVTRTFSSGSMIATSPHFSYTLTIHSWTAVTNSNAITKTAYPNGYTISGTITSMNRGDLLNDMSKGGVPDVGNSYSCTHFLNTSKRSILAELFIPEEQPFAVFTKQ